MYTDTTAWMTAPFLTPRTIPKIGLAAMAIVTANMTQCPIENDSIIATFARVQASRASRFRLFVGQRSEGVHCCLKFCDAELPKSLHQVSFPVYFSSCAQASPP